MTLVINTHTIRTRNTNHVSEVAYAELANALGIEKPFDLPGNRQYIPLTLAFHYLAIDGYVFPQVESAISALVTDNAKPDSHIRQVQLERDINKCKGSESDLDQQIDTLTTRLKNAEKKYENGLNKDGSALSGNDKAQLSQSITSLGRSIATAKSKLANEQANRQKFERQLAAVPQPQSPIAMFQNLFNQ